MAHTSYSQAWLEDGTAIRALFAFVDVWDLSLNSGTGGVGTKYLSTVGYVTEEANPIMFQPLITKGVEFTESLSITGDSAGLSYGTIELSNPNGELDDWLDPTKYIWKNQNVKIYLGDPSWVFTSTTDLKSKCLLIFDGVSSNLDSRSRESLNIQLRDKMEYINTPLTEEKYTGYEGVWPLQVPIGEPGETPGESPNIDKVKPVVFGEVFNMPPTLIDPATMKYQVNNGAIEKIIEIRDNGVPIFTDTSPTGSITLIGNGSFTLNIPAAGDLTASVQGTTKSVTITGGVINSNNIYSNNIAHIIGTIVTQYGKAETRLSSSDIDVSNFETFASTHTQSVGMYVGDKANVIDICKQLVSSVGGQLRMTRQGKLQILQLVANPTNPTFTINDADIIQRSFSISERPDVVASVKLGYCRAYITQDKLETGITAAAKSNLKEEWYTVTKTDEAVKALYKLTTEPEQQDTALVVKSEAEAEAQRRLDMFKVQRTVYRFTGSARLLSLSLGQQVTLKHNRFGLSAGKVGQVVNLKPDWLNSKVTVEVFV